jgi:transposase InsO family protein
MTPIAPRARPFYPPAERMAILELRSARGSSLEETARKFLVTAATIASWVGRIEEQRGDALVQLREPVNKFPDFAGAMVRRLKAIFPAMGKVKNCQLLSRAGLHLGVTTVGRMLKQQPETKPAKPVPSFNPEPTATARTVTAEHAGETKPRVVTANYPNHLWHVDLTAVPITGLWVPWLPFSLPQFWPFCWWVGVVVDHYSRRAMGFALYKTPPTSQAVRQFLGTLIGKAKATPKYIVCDKGSQFWCDGFKDWCGRKGIRPRFGAIGQHGSIAVVERFIETLKYCGTHLVLVSPRRESFRRELDYLLGWYNEFRPHATLARRTPNEAYRKRFPACRRPRYEPRPRWPRGSPCAWPHALVRGKAGVRLELEVTYHHGQNTSP